MTMETYQKYLDEVENGYLKIARHPEDENIIIMNYTPKAVVERRWNRYTMTARGLILDTTKAKNNKIYILAKPFEKFFNYSENKEYEKDIDFSTVQYVTEKMDGSLGISYFFEDEIRFATKGSFISDQAVKATELWKEHHEKYFDMKFYVTVPSTYLVEIIYPKNRIVVDYEKREGLVLLGVNFIDMVAQSIDQVDSDYDYVLWEAKRLHMMISPKHDISLSEALDKKKTISANNEGWIFRFNDNKRLKIKGDEYINVHRAMYGLSDKQKFRFWAEDNYMELIKNVPEEFREELEEFEDYLNDRLFTFMGGFTFCYEQMKHLDQKEYALKVNSFQTRNSFKGILFEAKKKGHVTESSVRKMMWKDYDEILKGREDSNE